MVFKDATAENDFDRYAGLDISEVAAEDNRDSNIDNYWSVQVGTVAGDKITWGAPLNIGAATDFANAVGYKVNIVLDTTGGGHLSGSVELSGGGDVRGVAELSDLVQTGVAHSQDLGAGDVSVTALTNIGNPGGDGQITQAVLGLKLGLG